MAGFLGSLSIAMLGSLLCFGCDLLNPNETVVRPVMLDAGNKQSMLTEEQLSKTMDRITELAGKDGMLLELRAEPEHISVQLSNPKHPQRVDEYRYTMNKVDGPIKVELRGDGDLEKNLFPIDKIHFDELPKLLRTAVEKVDPQDGKVVEIVLRRNYPLSEDVRFRLFVDSPRRRGYLDATGYGQPIGIN